MSSYDPVLTEPLTNSLFQSNPLACLVLESPSLALIASNKKARQLFHISTSGNQSLNFLNFLYTEDKPRFIKWLQGPGAYTAAGIFQLSIPAATVLTVELYVAPVTLKNESCLQLSVIDISQRLAVQKNLDEERDRYKTYIQQSSEGIYCYELKRPISVDTQLMDALMQVQKNLYLIECNDALAKMYGYEQASEMIGLEAEALLDFEDPINIEFVKLFIEKKFNLANAESHEKDRYGNSRYFLNNLLGIVEDGYLKHIWGTQRDITDQKQSEDQIRLLASLVEETSDVLTAADLDFKPLTWNKAAERIYGITAEQIIGNNLRDLIDISYKNTSKEDIRSHIAKTGTWRGEMYFTRPTDNKPVTLLITYKVSYNNKQQPAGYIISATDITDIKEAELKLIESENRFREMSDSAPVGIWITNTQHQTIYINKPLLDYIGLKADTAYNNWAAQIHPDDREEVLVKYRTQFNNRLPVTLIYRLKKKDGTFRWVQDSGTPRYLSDGTFIGFIGSLVDINYTQQHKLELQYQATVLNNVLDVIVTTDLNFNVLSWNRIASDYFNYTEAAAIGKAFVDLVTLDYAPYTRQQCIEELYKNGVWKGTVSYSANGEKRYLLHTMTTVYAIDGAKIGYMAVSRDITAQKKTEEQLERSEVFYRTLIADSLDGIILTDALGVISFASPSIMHILGYDPEEIVGRNGFEFVHTEDFSWALTSFNQEVKENPEIKFITIRLRKKSGEWVWCMTRGHNLLKNPYINGIVIHFHDDSLRKKANEALKESEQRFRNLISDLKLGVVLHDASGKVILLNNATVDMVGFPKAALLNQYMCEVVTNVIHENNAPFRREEWPIVRAINSKKPCNNVILGIKGNRPAQVTWLLLNSHPVLDELGTILHLITSITDVTERKKLVQRLMFEKINQQKLLTQATIDGQEKERREIGKELHDNIGQQLTTTKLYLDLAKGTADEATLELVNLAFKSISDVINEIRSISHALVPSTLGDLGLIESINELVDTMSQVQLITINFNPIEFDEDKVPENQKLTLYRILQEQLNNIVKHANASEIEVVLKNDKTSLHMEIIDNGDGFDIKKARKGLGLANIKSRVELFGGTVTIITAPGDGCTVKVFIPTTMRTLLF